MNSQTRQLEQNVEGVLADVVKQVSAQMSQQDEAIAVHKNEVRQIKDLLEKPVALPKKRPLQLERAKGSAGAEESERKLRPTIKPTPISEPAKKVPQHPKTPPPPKMLEMSTKAVSIAAKATSVSMPETQPASITGKTTSVSSSSQPVKAPQLRPPPLPLHGVTKIVKVGSLKRGKDQPVAKVDFQKREEKKESEKHVIEATSSSKAALDNE